MMFLFELLGKLKLNERDDLLKVTFSDEHELDDCQVEDHVKKILVNNIRRRLTPQAVKCRAGNFFSLVLRMSMFRYQLFLDVEVACYGYEGVDAVKAALREGLNASSEEMPVKVNDKKTFVH